jgi:hypothetical protein
MIVNQNISIAEIDNFNIHCYRKDGIPLVYLATYKCASTYYKTLLLDNGWDRIEFSSIDWTKDKVFSFISDPHLRYFKGIVQDLLNVENDELNEQIFNLIKNHKKDVLILTDHSLPIIFRLKNYAHQIDWIPIHDDFPHHEIFLKLLATYGITAEPGENLDPHIANNHKKYLYHKFKSALGEGSDLYRIAMAGNLDLFANVLANTDPAGTSWEEISWLKVDIPSSS